MPTAAEVTVDIEGQIYIGMDTVRELGIGHDSRVRVEIPRQSDENITVVGNFNSSHRVAAGGREIFDELKPDRKTGGSFHRGATVSALG